MGDVRFVDKGWNNILKRVTELAATRVQVGAIGPDAKRTHPHRAGTTWAVTIAEALLINEYGAGAGKSHVPARAPMRRTFARANPAIQEMGARAARMVIQFAGTGAQVMALMGRLGVDALRSTLAGPNPPSNAPRTVERKGFDHPLIWTGMLWESISHRVVKRDLAARDVENMGGIVEIGGDD